MLGETIKTLRKAKGLTQKQLAEKIGLSPPAVTQWETGGGIDMPNLVKVAKVLGVPSKVLVEAMETDRAATPSEKSAEASNILQDSDTSGDNTPFVQNGTLRTDRTREIGHMSGDEGLGNEVLKSLLRRMDAFEERLEALRREPATTRPDPQRRRKV
jgi:transcriptional regulator with XRE-family HTH domain